MPSIDFAELRATISMSAVLELLAFVASERNGDQLRGRCPVHGSSSEHSCSFSVNFQKNSFRCFRCGSAGNQLELWAAAKGVSIYDAALDLSQRLNVAVPTKRAHRSGPAVPRDSEKRNP